ncbi:hypothetical protein K6119_00600 [Paracrocinitomix mangrovi]|uniref:hypothetical protein n=1 Tax=Paracrocinitomix mangrovi TaxID=2862509 RepID=UPI001C8E8DA2|nr:hypothetical protein [Paracrocinitomix mangrovi]UKN02014.1 hypothetical protein K6119_00600 [Paracrocinitomix mangrovi]
MTFLRKIFKNKRPKGWNLTIADLMQELEIGERTEIKESESTWAREYEESLLSKSIRYPKKGDLYESICKQTITYMVAYMAPYTGGGEAELLPGEQIWITKEPSSNTPISAYAAAVEYKKLEERMVEKDERKNPAYDGFYLSVKSEDLNHKFKLIQQNFSKSEFE